MMTYSITYFPEEVIEHIFSFLESHRDRNLVSEVCKSWYRIESLSRRSVFVSNCYVLKPERVVGRFPKIRSLRVKGKPHFADFNMVPHGWGGFVALWIEAVVKGCPGLEELRLKRMVVTDEDLELLAKSFPNLKALVLDSCEGFSTDGLAAISTNCRFLRVLDLQENEVEDRGSQWLSCFPDSCTSLETLNFACLKGEVNPGALEKLVARSPNLKTLRLSRGVMAKTLMNILVNAPQLVDLGTGSFTLDPTLQSFYGLLHAFIKSKSLRSLSGFWDATQLSLMATNPVFSELTDLNLSYAPEIPTTELLDLIYQCNKLQRLWVLDSICDRGLAAVADTCKDLRELRVFPDINGEGIASVTEKGLVAISLGCPKLTTLLYFCHQMTNDALITVAKNCQNFTCFRLCIIEPRKPDSLTHQPLDEGFGAIVKSSKDLTRLSLSGLLTNKVFSYIGKYAEKLEMLSVAFAGDCSRGMVNVLNGCKNLRKLEIRDSPFGDSAILENVGKFETMRSLWMSSCDVTFGGCKSLAAKMPMLNVEVINESCDGDEVHEIPSDLHSVEKLYVYRTLAGPRDDAPNFVWTL